MFVKNHSNILKSTSKTIISLFIANPHLASFVTTPLSLIQASNGQVYILQNQQQTTTASPTSTTTPTGPGTTSTTGIPAGTAQFFPTQMILAADNSTLVLATNKLTSPTTLSTPTNWMQPTLQSSLQPFPPRLLVDNTSSKTVSTVQLDIDLTKSKKTADIVTKALVASKVLKGC